MSVPYSKDKIRLWLTIANFDCTPDDITTLLGLQPTRSSALRTEQRVPFWTISSPVDRTGSDPEAQWAGLQPLLVPLTAKLKALSTKASLRMELGVIAYETQCGLFFPTSLVSFAAEINASLDIDLYCLRNAENDELAGN